MSRDTCIWVSNVISYGLGERVSTPCKHRVLPLCHYLQTGSDELLIFIQVCLGIIALDAELSPLPPSYWILA
jgi:hypothetical protein